MFVFCACCVPLRRADHSSRGVLLYVCVCVYIYIYIYRGAKKCIHMLRDVVFVLLMCNVYTFFGTLCSWFYYKKFLLLKCNTSLSVPNTRLVVYRAPVMSVLLLATEYCLLVICSPFIPREYNCVSTALFLVAFNV